MRRSSKRRYRGSDYSEKEPLTTVDLEDLKIISAIRNITDRGHNAEIKRRSDGTLAVYEVEKRISIG